MDLNIFSEHKTDITNSVHIEETLNKEVAIIGISARLPMSGNIKDFWSNLVKGIDCITPFPDSRQVDTDLFISNMNINGGIRQYSPGGYLEDIDKFDYKFFRLSPKEAALMNPNQRLFLETAYACIEDAGYGGKKITGTNTGVYLGYNADALYDYKKFVSEFEPGSLSIAVPGNLTSIIPSRISYLFDLTGPSLSIDTACSSSMVAIHMACQGMLNGDCEMAIAGSVKLNLLPIDSGQKLGIESSDGRARAFDDSSDGTGMGEGVVAILMKPLNKALKDRDNIYAVIKGSAINQDGSSIGITAPNAVAQEKVISSAWRNARVEPETITYIEAHGTGTKLGDPIEIEGITRAFRKFTQKKQFCAIGSLKTNIGHLDNASGIAGLLKAVLSLKNAAIPPTLHFKKANREICFEESPVYVNTELKAWVTDGYPRRCGVSAFGLSGTNCHVVLEEPSSIKRIKTVPDNKLRVFTISAKTKKSLKDLIDRYRIYADEEFNGEDLNDVCYTANTGRGHYEYRLALLVKNAEDLKDKIKTVAQEDFCTIEEENKFYSELKKDRNDEKDNTEDVLRDLTFDAQHKIKLFIEGGKTDAALLKEICRLYVSGADIDWEAFYQDEKRFKVSLPAYAFEKNRCWLEVPQREGLKTNKVRDEKVAKKFTEKEKSISIAVMDRLTEYAGAQNSMAGEVTSPDLSEIEEYTYLMILKAFWDMNIMKSCGQAVSRNEMIREAGIIEKFERYFDALTDILARGRYIEINQNLITVSDICKSDQTLEKMDRLPEMKAYLLDKYTGYLHYINMLDICISSYKDVLTGKELGTNIVFPNSSTELIENIYKDDKNNDNNNELAAFCIKTFIEQRARDIQKGDRIRILEVGAGIGGTTAPVLKAIGEFSELIEYYYTDITSSFLEYGKNTYGIEYPFMTFKKLDLEKDIYEQGFHYDHFDIVLGANVIHATKNIRDTVNKVKSVMTMNGIFIMIEGTRVIDFSTVAFGLLDGWWLYEDEELRLKHAPMLSSASWQRVLSEEGFNHVNVIENDKGNQSLVIGESNGEVRLEASHLIQKQDENPKDKKSYEQGLDTVLTGRKNNLYSDIEKKVAIVWGEVLGLDEISIYDNFYELGGDSILAMKIIHGINKQFEINVDVTELMSHDTIGEFSAYLEGKLREEKNDVDVFNTINKVEEQEYYPVSSSQKRLFITHQIGEINTSYNVTAALLIEGLLDKAQIEKSIKALIQRHETLRTSFRYSEGEIVQKIHKEVDFNIDCRELINHSIDEEIKDFIRPFDLGEAPLFRVGLIKVETTRHILVFDVHHIITDGISINILIQEFIGFLQGKQLTELKIQYKDFAAWQTELMHTETMKEHEKYWCEMFSGELPVLDMPLDYQRSDRQTFEGKTIRFVIDENMTDALNKLAIRHNVTMNILLTSMYAMLLNKYTGQEEVVIGAITAGRNHYELEYLMGAFINFIPMRIRVNADETFPEFLKATEKTLLGMYRHQDYPYDKLLENLNINTERSRNPLFDTLFNYHNELENLNCFEVNGMVFSKFDFDLGNSKLDFQLDINIGENGELIGSLEYNVSLFKEETVKGMIKHYNMLLDTVISEAPCRLSEMEIFSEQEKIQLVQKRINNVQQSEEDIPLVVASTFTAEPLEEYIKWWCRQFNINTTVRFAPYNQVFQELLDASSMVSTNPGINLLLLRFEDWIRDDNSDENTLMEKLEKNFNELTDLIIRKKRAVPYFIGIFPTATHLNLSDKLLNFIQELNIKFKTVLKDVENVYVVDFCELEELYGISEIFDPVTDKEGHLPFSQVYYAAMGTFVARKIHALQKQQFKVIVLDCDNTLWKGICGEDGTEGIEVKEPFIALQRFMVQKQQEGMLLAICSKNNETDVWDVFEKNTRMLLKREHIAAWRINWQDKADNIRQLAEELNLGLDSFIFIDDSPYECSQVMANCPEVLTLQLPERIDDIPFFLRHVWAFDRLTVTEEDKKRTSMYLEEKNRQEIRNAHQSLEDFIKGLELGLCMEYVQSAQIARVSQLTQRTNQFNMSTVRRSEDEIRKLMEAQNVKCWAINVRDRFGDYGLVGVVIGEESSDKLFLDSFILSCRVLGRGVEDAILSCLGDYCRHHHLCGIEARYYPTDKNTPVQEFIKRTYWDKIEENGEYKSFVLPVDRIPALPDYIKLYDQTVNEEVAVGRISEPDGESMILPINTGISNNIAKDRFRDEKQWKFALANEHQLVHRNHLLPIEHSTAFELLTLPVYESHEQSISRAGYKAPSNEIEIKLTNLWEDLLKIDKVGAEDNFFKLGGHSLKVALLLSRIHKEFGAEVTFKEIFEHPTIRELAEIIGKSGRKSYSLIHQIDKRDYYPVSSVQKRLYILSQQGSIGTSYNIPVMTQLQGSFDEMRLNKAFKELIGRHEVLRTSFVMERGEVVQRVHEQVDFELSLVMSEGRNIQNIIERFIQPFDLSQAPLIRGQLVKVSEDHHILMLDMHHIISDGTSAGIILKEIADLYAGERLPELKVQYKDFSHWQMEQSTTDAYKKQEQYWLKVFSGEIPVLNMPSDYPRPAAKTFRGSKTAFIADGELTESLRKLTGETETTLYMVLLAAYNILLMKYAMQEDVVIGTPVAGRSHADLENLIGMFVNTLAIRNKPLGDKTLNAFLNEVKGNTLKAFENQNYPFEALVDHLGLIIKPDRNPLYDAAFILLNMDFQPIKAEKLKLTPYPFESHVSQVDLTLIASENEEGIGFEFEYCTDLFKMDTIKRMADSYLKILKQMIKDKNIKIKDIQLEEKHFEKKSTLYDEAEFNF